MDQQLIHEYMTAVMDWSDGLLAEIESARAEMILKMSDGFDLAARDLSPEQMAVVLIWVENARLNEKIELYNEYAAMVKVLLLLKSLREDDNGAS